MTWLRSAPARAESCFPDLRRENLVDDRREAREGTPVPGFTFAASDQADFTLASAMASAKFGDLVTRQL